MSERFNDLIKLSPDPAAKQLSLANAELKTKLEAKASASPVEVLAELEAKEAWLDMLQLMAVLLPPRERVWWACLAARDAVGPKSKDDPLPLTTAEAWVFKPDEDHRIAAQQSLDTAKPADKTKHCARAVLFFDGTLGPGDLAQHPAPQGVAASSAFAMNLVALKACSDTFDAHMQVLIDRALDIARGGNGRVEPTADGKEEDA